MDLLRRVGEILSPSGEASEEPPPGPVERNTPGISALFGGIDEDASHAVLDLERATGSSLRVYERFAAQVRFADLLAIRSERGLAGALSDIRSQPERPYDLVFAWNTLDRIPPPERSHLVRRLTEVSAPGARLHVVADASEGTTTEVPVRFSLLGVDRMRYELDATARPVRDRLLPADMEQLLAPFRVVRGFTSQTGLREYVAFLEERSGRGRARPA